MTPALHSMEHLVLCFPQCIFKGKGEPEPQMQLGPQIPWKSIRKEIDGNNTGRGEEEIKDKAEAPHVFACVFYVIFRLRLFYHNHGRPLPRTESADVRKTSAVEEWTTAVRLLQHSSHTHCSTNRPEEGILWILDPREMQKISTIYFCHPTCSWKSRQHLRNSDWSGCRWRILSSLSRSKFLKNHKIQI